MERHSQGEGSAASSHVDVRGAAGLDPGVLEDSVIFLNSSRTRSIKRSITSGPRPEACSGLAHSARIRSTTPSITRLRSSSRILDRGEVGVARSKYAWSCCSRSSTDSLGDFTGGTAVNRACRSSITERVLAVALTIAAAGLAADCLADGTIKLYSICSLTSRYSNSY